MSQQKNPLISSLSIGGATYDLFLTINPTYIQGDSLVLTGGEKIGVKQVTETCGGGACNTSIGLARLGCNASFCGVLGGDQWGTRLLETMKQERVNVHSATIVDHETSSFSIIVNLPSGERSILASPGTSEHLRDVTFDKEAIQGVQCVYLNHLCASACEIENDLIDMLKKNPDIHLTWNPGGSQIHAGMHEPMKKALLARTSLLLLNREEVCDFTQTSDVHAAMTLLREAGATTVCVTDGKNGVFGKNAHALYHCPVVPETVIVDTTGAGDAFGTAATWALLEGKPLPEALIAGTLHATSVLGAVGAQAGLLTREKMLKALTTHSLHVQTIND